jgi:hypothetical protein
VTYNVTRYEPYTTTRQVAVSRTKMVAEEVTVQRPVTTYRTVPVGTTVAYAPIGGAGSAVAFGGGTVTNVAYGPIRYDGGGTATAYGPRPDPISAQREERIRSRTAERIREEEGKPPAGQEFKRSAPPKNNSDFGDVPGAGGPKLPTFRRLSSVEREELLSSRRLARTEQPADEVAAAHQALKPVAEEAADDQSSDREPALAVAFVRPHGSIPVAVRSVRWTPSKPSGPALIAPALAAAE